MDLIEFLRARLDEDEATARATLAITYGTLTEGYSANWPVETDGDWTSIPEIGLLGGYTMTPGYIPPEHVRHIARHDPERVLREVQAKRLILADHERFVAERRRMMGGWYTPEAGPILTALASVYADHPDYREDWRP